MPKFILLMMTATCLVLGLACSTANSPATSGQQPDSIAGDSAGTEPTETSPSGGTSDRSGRVPEQTIAVLGQGESTDSPRRAASSRDSDHDSEAEVQTGMSSFQDEIGREYPGLLSLPECSSDTQLTMVPLQDDAYQVIIPLGLLSTPQHVLPTSHVYYHLVRETIESGGYGPPAVAEVRAPGDIRVLRLNSSESIKGPRGPYIDYDITFAPCRGMMYQFLHVSTLIPRLEKLFVAGLTGRCDEYGDEQSQYRLCQSSVRMDLPVGTLMGTTGGKVSAALDLEAYDLDGPSLSYANSAQFGSPFDLRLKVTCPFDGFTAEVEQQQLARMGDYDLQPRTAEPRCGEVMQDIPGTAQGNWYTGETGAHANWSQELALVHDNVDPTLTAISIGGTVSSAGVWLFAPESTGLVNRDFSAVSAEGGQTPAPFPGRLLISLNNDTEMLVERQDGDCTDGVAFITPVPYNR